jgi:NodT family efflux transporter outer membrane factor (OMF) lipoprotein
MLIACKVGPNFRSPPLPIIRQYAENKIPVKTESSPGLGGDAQTFVTFEDIPILWWELFHSKAINQLIRRGFANSPNVAAAAAALRVARENVNVQIGNSLWPAVDGNSSAQRQRFASSTVGNASGEPVTFNLFSATVSVSYTPDLFGGERRQIESLIAQVDSQQFQVIAAYLTLASNIVTTAITLASYEAQIEATLSLIKSQDNLYVILQKQFFLGAVSKASVLTQKTLLEQTRATLPPLQKNLSITRHALTTLIGTFPDDALPVIKLDEIKLPVRLPISLPSLLVRQRPDVRAAEALMHAACAQIGVATANLFPSLTLTGNYGWLSSSLSNLFSPQSNIWSIAGQLTQPLFRGGALLAQRRANIAAYQQAEAQYRQTVLTAFQNVADVLRALETDASALKAQTAAERAASEGLQLTLNQYRLGGASYIDLLNSQQLYEQTRISQIQAQAARFADTAALFQALGGGWWHKPWCTQQCL